MRSTSRWMLFPLLALAGASSRASDPVLGPPYPTTWCNARFSRVYGGWATDTPRDAAVDASSSTYVVGSTSSVNFPVTPGAFDTTHNGGYDVFVLKLASNGSIVYATFVGGSLDDYGGKIAVDGSGNAYVTGITHSSNYPTTAGAFDTTLDGYWDAFVTKLSADGSAMAYSTYMGGSAEENGTGLAVDAGGRAIMGAESSSVDYPTTPGAFDTTPNGSFDVVVTALSPAGDALVYSTYIGGSAEEYLLSLTLDGSGNAYVVGETESFDYPVTPGVVQGSIGGSPDGFVTKLSPSGAALSYSTYLGSGDYDAVWGIAVDAAGAAYVTGRTDSWDFPVTPGAFDTTMSYPPDSFLTKLAPGATSLVYSTFLGGNFVDEAWGVAVAASGAAYVVGSTISTDFPVTGNACQGPGTDREGFFLQMNPTGSALLYGTYIGRAGADGVAAVRLGPSGAPYIAGYLSRNGYDTYVMSLP